MHGAGGGRHQRVGCRGALSFSDVVVPCLSECVSFLQRLLSREEGLEGVGPPRCSAPPPHPRLWHSPDTMPLGLLPAPSLPLLPACTWTVVSALGLGPSCSVSWPWQGLAICQQRAAFTPITVMDSESA